MKKIPTLFKRVFDEKTNKIVKVLPEVTPGMEWVLAGEGIATIKVDGSCCAIIDGVFYKRYDAKNGKPVPDGAIKCQEEADPITGHLPCWVKVNPDDPADKWFMKAYNYAVTAGDGTYEAIGQHFQGNPYNLRCDTLAKHGISVIDVPRSYDGIREYLETHNIEGIVFWKAGEPKCKIKRSDFGFKWPMEESDAVYM